MLWFLKLSIINKIMTFPNKIVTVSVLLAAALLLDFCCGSISVSRTFTSISKDIHKKNLQAGNYAKECQLNRARPRELEDKSYKISKSQR